MITETLNTYGDRVPNQPKTPRRSVRVDDPEWEAAEAVAKRIDWDRSRGIRDYFNFFFHKPDVDLSRPPLPVIAEAIAAEIATLRSEVAEMSEADRGKLEARVKALEEMARKVRERAQA